MAIVKIFIILLVSSLFNYLCADEIILTSGDHLYGEVKEINSQYIVIDTAFAKALKLEQSAIESLAIDQAVELVFNDGNIQSGYIQKDKDSPLALTSEQDVIVFDASDLANEKTVAQAKRGTDIIYKGAVDLGLRRATGNNDEEDYRGALRLSARTRQHRYTLQATKRIENNDGDRTQDEFFTALQADRFITDKWYAFASTSFEEDFEQALDLRTTYSLGSGYQIYDREDLTMKAELGVAYIDEKFEDSEDDSYVGSRWAYDYTQQLFSWVSAFHNHEILFSVENTDDINMRSQSGFELPLNQYINAKLQANIDWNRTPADGAATTDKEYLFTLGYKF